MFMRFEPSKSTKGASKMRRDLINSEISNLRDLLPLPPSTRQRLSQLQLMALVCVYVRKMNYFQQLLKSHDFACHYQEHTSPTPNIGFSKALNGFLMMMTQSGKLLYISENAAEYLGHSMEDLLIHGDSVYDIIDRQDHQTVQNELTRGPSEHNISESRTFFCRMNVSRNSRRQMRFGDQKVVLIRGHFVSYLPLCSRNEPVFLASCTPLAMPETRECIVHGATNVFTTIHTMDMKILHVDTNAEFYLGWKKSELQDVSWYQILHWDSLREAQTKHKLISQSEQDKCCILLAKLQKSCGGWLWAHIVLQVKESNEQPQNIIVATNQVLSEEEATIMMSHSWLYHYYGYQNQPCNTVPYDPRNRVFRREAYYQECYQQEPYYPEPRETTPYQGVPYGHVDEQYLKVDRPYPDRGPVDYSNHSPHSSVSEDRSPHPYEYTPPDMTINGEVYLYPTTSRTDHPDITYSRPDYVNYDTYTVTSIDQPSSKRLKLPTGEGMESIERWNPSPPWSDTAMKMNEINQRFSYPNVIHLTSLEKQMTV